MTIKRTNEATVGTSRRRFIQNCTVGVIALSSGSLLGCLATHKAAGQRGAAGLTFSLDQNWLFGDKFTDAALSPGFNDSAFKQVTLPHVVSRPVMAGLGRKEMAGHLDLPPALHHTRKPSGNAHLHQI
jgi:hypothetical protein